MSLNIFLVQFSLGVFLFFILNWIGRHSYPIGYVSISLFVKAEEAPAFNFVIRVLAPIVYLIICAAIFYTSGLDMYLVKFYLVNLYYILFRLFFNIITERRLLLSWYRQALYWASILSLSFFTYEKIIITKKYIFPDFTTIANELWIVIAVFIYHIANNIQLSQEGTIRRKESYLKLMYNDSKNLYGHIIDNKFPNKQLEIIAYSILIYENFNRPKIVRFMERLMFRITKRPHTLGIMQVHIDEIISNDTSVSLGTDKIMNSYNKHLEQYEKGKKDEYYGDWGLINDVIGDYNTGTEYIIGVSELCTIIKERFYKNVNTEIIKNQIE